MAPTRKRRLILISMHLVYSIKVETAEKYIFLGKKWLLEMR